MGSPAFSSLVYKENIETSHPGEYEVKLPYVLKQGNCPLEEAEYELTLGEDHASLGTAVCSQTLQEQYD